MIIFSRLIDKHIAEYQNDLIEKHCEEVENMYRQMRGVKHDLKHHIQTMKAHLIMNQYKELEEYLNELDEDLDIVDTVIKTGNIRIDAVLNSKLAVARARGININAKAIVPAELEINEVDICVIIGNLLDNAIEACEKEKEKDKQFIRVYIDILKQQLYIYISNSMTNDIQKSGGRYITTKDGSHGFGLLRIDRVVKKYGGYLNRQHEEGVFATEIMLPL
ncbi:MAG: sensor histidine kinase [Lachnospiraceae bacterium]|jgi:two-component system sensor histidine kinase AgrC